MTDYIVSSGVTSSGVTLGSAGHPDLMSVLSGGTALNTGVGPDGTVIVSSGGLAIGTTVQSGGSQSLAGGTASATAVNGGGVEIVSVGGTASGTTVSSGGREFAEAGGTTVDTTISQGMLEIGTGASAAGKIDFASNSDGRLQIDGPAMPVATIRGLVPGDTIDLANVAFSSAGSAAVVSGNVLQISEDGTTYALNLDPAQNFSGDVFQLSADAAGSGTLVTAEALCFCRGTMILTDKGEVPVEELAVGDRVKTLSGAFKPIQWIGFGRDLVTRANRLARPVVVRRGALADDVPRRDLYLTHGHALYVDGVLIPVENLVNHRSIHWDETARVVEYYHIELADYDLLVAEGAPAESYYDAGNRAFFHNTREGSAPGAEKPTYAPVLNSGKIVETVWAKLFERAGLHLERNTTDDPDIHLVVDGARLDPTATDGAVYRFALERPPADTLLLCSRSGVPSLLGLDRSDHRPLGVAIRQIVLYHAGIPTSFDYDAPQFREGGCHLPEDGYSWTDGEFELPARFFTLLNGAFTLIVQTSPSSMRYPIPARVTQAA